MADSRLDELHRQRTLVQEHLAWIDREIRAEELVGKPHPKTPTTSREQPPSLAVPREAAGDDILEQYRVPATSLQSDVRKGCWLYLVGALVVLGLIVAVLYVTISRR